MLICTRKHNPVCVQITVSFLVEVDKLIQLLESPIFTFVRIQLLDPQSYAYLIKALFGLLMLLPQVEIEKLISGR